jgi:ADP-ribose pyrophosphatase YjhB (NUDIX family)
MKYEGPMELDAGATLIDAPMEADSNMAFCLILRTSGRGREDSGCMKYEGPVELDAGAILIDAPMEADPNVALIRRAQQADWTLPKGHVESGESLEQAATRELLEETGYAGQLLSIAGATAYEHEGRAKSVTYFYFMRRGQAPVRGKLDGVAQVEWMTFQEALERVTYPELAELLARVAPAGHEARSSWDMPNARPGTTFSRPVARPHPVPWAIITARGAARKRNRNPPGRVERTSAPAFDGFHWWRSGRP